MNLVELRRSLTTLRLGGMAESVEARILQAQSEKLAPIDFVSALVAHSTHVDHRFRGEADRAFHAKSITRAVVTGLVFATSTASTCWSNSR
ncbi:MAG: hypothetical protein Q8N26_03755, partial [Myxococcales bacterium]|nr:hypothetical protein [Myxococcales bacterium]